MFAKLSKRSDLKNILVISLSNIGDVIVTCPVIDILRRDFPQARICVVVGPKAESLFKGNPHIDHVYVFNKQRKGLEHLAWVRELRREYFDLIVDLRNSATPFMLRARHRTPPVIFVDKKAHLTKKHLDHFKSIYDFEGLSRERFSIVASKSDQQYVDGLLKGHGIVEGKRFVVVAPVAADSSKTWLSERFAAVCDEWAKRFGVEIVFVGTKEEGAIVETIQKRLARPGLNLCGRTDLVQLAEVIKRASLAFVNDSGAMHIASYFDIPILALFGPTKPGRTAPWSTNCRFIWKNQDCEKCRKPSLEIPHQCMGNISVDDVLRMVNITPSGQVEFRSSNTQ